MKAIFQQFVRTVEDLLGGGGLTVPIITSAYVRTGISAKTADFTIDPATDGTHVFVDSTAAAVTATLPSASAFPGVAITVVRVNGGGNNVTVATVAGGNKSITIQYGYARVVSNGTAWYAVGEDLS